LPLVQAAVIYILVNDYREATYFSAPQTPKARCSTASIATSGHFPKCAAFCRPLARHRLVADGARHALFRAAETSQRTPPTSALKSSTPTHWKFNADGSLTVIMSHKQPAHADGAPTE